MVVTLLAFDLGVLPKDDHEIEVKESLYLSAGYISVAMLFGTWVWTCVSRRRLKAMRFLFASRML